MEVSSHHVLWVDLETTGADLEDNYILELGAVLTDESMVEYEGGRFTQVISKHTYRSEFISSLFQMDPVVVDMHVKNGLIAEILKQQGLSLDVARNQLYDWLMSFSHLDYGNVLIPLAGSGVHFDRKFLKRDFPDFYKNLTYWSYDVGVIRRTLRLAGVEVQDQSNKAHRALQDAVDHAAEMRTYLDWLQDADAEMTVGPAIEAAIRDTAPPPVAVPEEERGIDVGPDNTAAGHEHWDDQ